MAKKGSKFMRYGPEIKEQAVKLYVGEGMSAREVAARLGLKSKTQVQEWVKRHQRSGTFAGNQNGKTDQRKGCRKTKFSSMEEELGYIKAENEYLKKQYPNLHKGGQRKERDSR